MDAAFQKAADLQPRGFSALGLHLRPLTLGHLFLLHHHNSGFVGEDAPTVEDLILSVFICAQGHADARKTLSRQRGRVFFWLWGMTCRRLNLTLEMQRFNAYFAYHTSVPAARAEGPDGRELRAPAHWRLLTMLMVDFRMDQRTALNTPLLDVHCLWATEAERNGSVELLSGGRLDEFWEAARRMDEEKFGARNEIDSN